MLNSSRTKSKKAEARTRYAKANREVKQSIRKDRRNFVKTLQDRQRKQQAKAI